MDQLLITFEVLGHYIRTDSRASLAQVSMWCKPCVYALDWPVGWVWPQGMLLHACDEYREMATKHSSSGSSTSTQPKQHKRKYLLWRFIVGKQRKKRNVGCDVTRPMNQTNTLNSTCRSLKTESIGLRSSPPLGLLTQPTINWAMDTIMIVGVCLTHSL